MSAQSTAPLSHQRRGSGEPLLLLHGLGSQWQMWGPVLDPLAKSFDVIAVDLPGFGDSAPLGPGVIPTVDALARSVVAFLDQQGLGEVHVAGNSLGGWIALELAKLDRARSVVAISPAGFASRRQLSHSRTSLRMNHTLARLASPLAPALLATRTGRALLLAQMFGRPARVPAAEAVLAVRNFASCPGFHSTLEALSTTDGFTGGDRVRCPVTVAWGTRDRLLPPRQLVRVREKLPQARIALLDGCGHVPTWDDPEQVVALLYPA